MLPAKPFYLIRHGQSEANIAQVAAGGGVDSPLTETGRGQARALAPYMTQLALKPTVLHHSFMQRAFDTARILNEPLGLPMTSHRDLREHDLGQCEGLPWSEVEPILINKKTPPGGESPGQFSQRAQATLTAILNGTDDLPLIVAHGGVFHALGFLYDYAMGDVNNCHLHHFEPYPSFPTFPWRVWQFDIEGPALVKRPAPFCLSRALERIGGMAPSP